MGRASRNSDLRRRYRGADLLVEFYDFNEHAENVFSRAVAFLLTVPSEARDVLLGSLWEGQQPEAPPRQEAMNFC